MKRDLEKLRAWHRRSKPLARTGALKRKAKLPPVNRKRKAKTKLEQFGPKERRRFVRTLACIVPGCNGPSENAHNPSVAAGGKAADVSPICRAHHTEQHLIGIQTWQRKYGLDVEATNAATEELWADYQRRNDDGA